MKIIRGFHNLKDTPPNLCLTMGNFDGLHIGHRMIIKAMLKRAINIRGKGVLLTFNPHPRWVLNPESPTLLLTSLHEQVEILRKWNLDILLLARFNRTFANIGPEDFVKKILVDKLRIKEIFVGEGFTFGYNKAGDIKLLEGLGKRYGFIVNRIKLLSMGKEVISSTLIREKILSGQIEGANLILGRSYSLTGRVIRGCGRGWHIGYPTANLKVISKIMPPKGVYQVKVKKQENIYPGIVNLGYKPTFVKDGEMGVEVYVLGLNEDIYGQKLTIYFQRWIREEIAFTTAKDLVKQIKSDIDKVHQWIMNQPN